MKEAIDKLSQAVLRLKEGILNATDDLDKDGVIQRFEFTFELFWKTLKIYLNDKGVVCRTPKDSLKEAFNIGFLGDEATFLNMLLDRNRTSHVYSQKVSEEIFKRIQNEYFPAIEGTLKKLQKELS